MAYDFNLDLYTLSPEAFRARWACGLRDFNNEEILRMRASTPPPRRLLFSERVGETVSIDYEPPANVVVVATSFTLTAANDAMRHLFFQIDTNPTSDLKWVSLYAYEVTRVFEGFWPTVHVSGFQGDEQLLVNVYGYEVEY